MGRGKGPESTLLIYDHWGEYTLSKKPGGWYTPYTRVYPPNTPLLVVRQTYINGLCVWLPAGRNCITGKLFTSHPCAPVNKLYNFDLVLAHHAVP